MASGGRVPNGLLDAWARLRVPIYVRSGCLGLPQVGEWHHVLPC